MKSRKSRGYITKLGLWPTSRLNQRWESRVTAHLESQLGKGPRQHIRSAGETSQIAVQGFPLVIPGWTQTDIIINLWPNCKPVFLLMLSVLYKTWNVVKPGAWLARPPPGAQQPQDFPPSYLWRCKPCTHSRQSLPVRTVSSQVRSKVRGLLCIVSEA